MAMVGSEIARDGGRVENRARCAREGGHRSGRRRRVAAVRSYSLTASGHSLGGTSSVPRYLSANAPDPMLLPCAQRPRKSYAPEYENIDIIIDTKSVISEANRYGYTDKPIVLADGDGAVGKLPFSGTISDWLQALQTAYPVEVTEHADRYVIQLRRDPQGP
jgi:hypothetical protein